MSIVECSSLDPAVMFVSARPGCCSLGDASPSSIDDPILL